MHLFRYTVHLNLNSMKVVQTSVRIGGTLAIPILIAFDISNCGCMGFLFFALSHNI